MVASFSVTVFISTVFVFESYVCYGCFDIMGEISLVCCLISQLPTRFHSNVVLNCLEVFLCLIYLSLLCCFFISVLIFTRFYLHEEMSGPSHMRACELLQLLILHILLHINCFICPMSEKFGNHLLIFLPLD